MKTIIRNILIGILLGLLWLILLVPGLILLMIMSVLAPREERY